MAQMLQVAILLPCPSLRSGIISHRHQQDDSVASVSIDVMQLSYSVLERCVNKAGILIYDI